MVPRAIKKKSSPKATSPRSARSAGTTPRRNSSPSTDDNQVEAALRQSEERFRAFTSNTNDVVYCMSPDWTEMRHLWGREFIPDTLESSRTWLDKYIHVDDRQHVMETIQRAIQSKSVFELEHHVIRVDGSLGWTHSRAIPILDDRGEIVEWFGAASDVTQHKQVEAALRAVEARQRVLLKSAPVVLYACKVTGDYGATFVSENVVEQLGHRPEDFTADPEFWVNHIHPDDRSRIMAGLSTIFETGQHEHEYRFLRKDGTYCWLHDHVRVIRDEAGVPLEMIGLQIDISQRKQSEEQLQESQARADLLARVISQLLRAADPQLVLHEVCNNVREFLHCSVFFNYLLDPQTRRLRFNACGGVDPRVARLVEGLELSGSLCGMAAKDNRRVLAENLMLTGDQRSELVRSLGVRAYACHPLRGPGNQALGTLSFGATDRDVFSEDELAMMKTVADHVAIAMLRSGTEEALRQSEERLGQAIRLAKLGIFDHDHRTGTLYWSPLMREIYGVPSDEPASLDGYIQMIHPHDRDAVVGAIRRAHDPSGDGLYAVEHRLLRRDGTIRWVSFQSRTLFEGDGPARKPVRTMGAMLDMTDRKQAEEALYQKQRELQQSQAQLQDLTAKLFTAQDSERQRIARDLHDDISQRLAALVLDVGSLQRHPPLLPELIEKALEPVREELKQLSDELHNVAYRLDPPLLRHVGLQAAIEDHIDKAIERTGLRITLEANNLPDSVPLDWSTCLFRVFQESLQNVAKHAKATEVLVGLSGFSKGIGLSVIDNGKGFDARDKSSHQKGLGLTSMQERLRLLNGFLNIHSRPADGTKVCAWIPFQEKKP